MEDYLKFLDLTNHSLGIYHFIIEESAHNELPKRNKLKEANVVDDISKDMSEIDLTAVISEVNLVGSNPMEWWIDTGANRHVCSDKMMFSTFEPIDTGEKVFMGNSATSDIKGQGKVVLKMTSGKELTLTNVLYVPEIRKNLVSGSLLNSHGFWLVFESDKFVLSKSEMYVGKGYMSGGMWKLNVMTIIKPKMNKASSSAYILESSNLWHGRLGHVNCDTLRKLINLNHIPTFQIDAKHKCETCVKAKLTRSSFILFLFFQPRKQNFAKKSFFIYIYIYFFFTNLFFFPVTSSSPTNQLCFFFLKNNLF